MNELTLLLFVLIGIAGNVVLTIRLVEKTAIPSLTVPIAFSCFMGALLFEQMFLSTTNPAWPVAEKLFLYALAWCGIGTVALLVILGAQKAFIFLASSKN